MRKLPVALAAAALTAPLALLALPATPAAAHGSLSNPPSRSYACHLENPENPTSAACKAAVAAGGSQAFYDWHEVSLLDAGGRSREIIPDGKLCSAGREKYRGLDLPRADWPATKVSAGPLTVTYHATAPHANSNFQFFITRQGYQPTQPLRWADLVPVATFNNQNPTTFTNWTITLPQRTGRHILYSIWQRVQGSAEAFYTCSDVDFGGGTTPTPPPPPTTPPVTSPTTPPPPPATPPATPPAAGSGTWKAYVPYRINQKVTFDGRTYTCRQSHTALPGWEPPNVLALWLPA